MSELVRQLNAQGLCDWLREKSGINSQKLEDALNVIIEQDIEGANFLTYTYNMWVSHPCNLRGGIANHIWYKLHSESWKVSLQLNARFVLMNGSQTNL
jgi:hypothetical protein